MRSSFQAVLAGTLAWALAAACTTKDSLLDPGAAGSDGGADGGTSDGSGGSAAGTTGGSAGSDGATAGVSSSAGGRAGSGTAGSGNGSTAGNESGGSGAEGGSGAGTSGDGSGGTAAGAGGSVTAGTGGTTSCPPGQAWCPGCTPGSGTCATGCPGAACGPCDMVESLEECEGRTDCHSVFVDSLLCDCVEPGCCASFAFCADDNLVDCTGANATCGAANPYCSSPAYVVSYSDFCSEGCVAPKDCAPSPPTPCPPSVPIDGAACGGDTQCYYDACPEGGRAIATCSNRAWSVETGTTCTVECAGVGQQCSEGQTCLVHAGGALLVECIENGCGTGPILEECAGNCPVFFSLYGGTTATCNTCPQGGCP
ncbi:MAG TPA: hypothetical protein VGK73_34345 [Polyangiaceae bacterium]